MIDVSGEFDFARQAGPSDTSPDFVVVAAIEGKDVMSVADVGFEITESLGECKAELKFIVRLIRRFSIPEARSEMFESKLKTTGPDRISI